MILSFENQFSILQVDEALPDLRLRSMPIQRRRTAPFRQLRRSHPGLFGFDVYGEKAMQ
jgi:hypothetical protein